MANGRGTIRGGCALVKANGMSESSILFITADTESAVNVEGMLRVITSENERNLAARKLFSMACALCRKVLST